ncbi:hypothetical protein ISM_07580 [Roseovarius nubinhibens ISM]|uniref:Uncharacterized protein n=1 Tax=Roseovarius nubinhibens (strain ATCC BAA-591 / DSM 15170 / ISM) TaxID=89187 RepID=A3SLA8_ROSNI|nr:hypothetical protein ISM_07580 [Roseovarius nubinhibens ISM]
MPRVFCQDLNCQFVFVFAYFQEPLAQFHVNEYAKPQVLSLYEV